MPEVLALSLDEKLQLMDELWQDVGQNLSRQEIPAEQKQLLDERWATFERDPSSALSLEDFKTAVRAARG